MDDLVQRINDLIEKIKGKLDDLLGKVNDFLGWVPWGLGWLADKIKDAWNWLCGKFEEFWDGVTKITSNMGDRGGAQLDGHDLVDLGGRAGERPEGCRRRLRGAPGRRHLGG